METLSSTAMMKRMADALPTHRQGDDSSDLASSYEAIALLVHVYLAALNFRLCGFDEDKPLPEPKEPAPRLPPQWNSGFGSLSFVYKHEQSSMRFVIRVDRMGAKVEVRGLAVGDENIHRFERTVRDVVLSRSLPVRIAMTEQGQEDRRDLVTKMSNLFPSATVVDDILHDFKVKIVQKLVPKLQVAGYIESETGNARADAYERRRVREAPSPNTPFRSESNPNTPHPPRSNLPAMARPRPMRPIPMGDFPPPDFEDEHEFLRPPRSGGATAMPGRSPYDIGHDDLNPPNIGPHNPLRNSFVGGRLPLPGGYSGMHPTFDDPLFAGQGGPAGVQGRYDAQAPPPGARWDPVGPGGGPRFPGHSGGRGNNNPYGGYGGGDII